MGHNFNCRSAQQQRHLAKPAQKVDATIFSICSPTRGCWERLRRSCRSTDFRRGERLGARDHLVWWWSKPARLGWMSVEEYRGYPDEIKVREVKVGKKVLVSTFLSPRKTPKAVLGELFLQRWNVELDLRNIKTTLGMEALSCKTPQMCEKEFWAYLLAYNLIRLLMAEAALQADVLPRQLSFKHTLRFGWRGVNVSFSPQLMKIRQPCWYSLRKYE